MKSDEAENALPPWTWAHTRLVLVLAISTSTLLGLGSYGIYHWANDYLTTRRDAHPQRDASSQAK